MIFQPFSHIFTQKNDILFSVFTTFLAISAFQAFPARVATLYQESTRG